MANDTLTAVEQVARALAAAEGEHWFGSDAYKKHNNRWLKLANAAIDALAKQARPAPTDAGAALREALQEHGDFPALDEIDWNDAAHTFLSSFEQARPEPVNERLLSALKDIRDAAARRQLPLTDQIWRAADSAIAEATNRMEGSQE